MEKIRQEDIVAKAAAVVCKQGMIPFPVSAAAIEIIDMVAGDSPDALALISAFDKKSSQTLEELAATSGFGPDKAGQVADNLASRGLVFNQPSSSGQPVFRLMPFMMIGLMEYLFMGELTGSEREKKLARLFEEMIGQLNDKTQAHYDELVPLFEAMPALDRTVPQQLTHDGKAVRVVPVKQTLDLPDEFILPSQSVDEIIDKFDDIAVGHCFCRQRRGLLGEPCQTQAPALNCFTFGKSARFTSAQGFAKMVTKAEARQIMAEAEEAGLVHKAFHPGGREDRLETSICNCCKDCCDTMNLWRNGTTPLVNATFHLALVDGDACTGCGICEARCPTEAIAVDEEGRARVDAASCFGCGVCTRFCPDDAIALKQGLRRVFVLPPRVRK